MPRLKPGVRKRWVQALHLLEKRDAFGDSIAVDQGERVVEFSRTELGREIESLLNSAMASTGWWGFQKNACPGAVAFDDRIFRRRTIATTNRAAMEIATRADHPHASCCDHRVNYGMGGYGGK